MSIKILIDPSIVESLEVMRSRTIQQIHDVIAYESQLLQLEIFVGCTHAEAEPLMNKMCAAINGTPADVLKALAASAMQNLIDNSQGSIVEK